MLLNQLHWILKCLVGKFDTDSNALIIALMNRMMLEFYIGQKVVKEMHTAAFVLD